MLCALRKARDVAQYYCPRPRSPPSDPLHKQGRPREAKRTHPILILAAILAAIFAAILDL